MAATTEVTKRGIDGQPKEYTDGVETLRASRWQKYGNDRIYPESATDGHVDLAAGEVVDLTPHYGSGVDEYEFQFDAESDTMELVEIPRPDVAQKHGAESRVVARIPRSVFN